jgi:hypothetical protein
VKVEFAETKEETLPARRKGEKKRLRRRVRPDESQSMPLASVGKES